MGRHDADAFLGIAFSGAIAVNRDSWDALPAEVQEAMTKAGAHYTDAHGRDLLERPVAVMQKIIEAGATLTPPVTRSFATGVVAGSSVLGMLIPPSLPMIAYAVLAEETVGRMFLAGVGPGLLLAGLFCVVILLPATFRPRFAFDRGEDHDEQPALTSPQMVAKGVPILSLMGLVLGELYRVMRCTA